jgi:hypothetical protein
MKRLLAGIFLFATSLHAEPRAFTDNFGRSITAEILSVEGDQVRIRREDGQLFDLPISKLIEADQKFISNWAAAKAGAATTKEEKSGPDPKKIIVGVSRAKFSSRTLSKYDGYTHKHEDWGYSIQVTNHHLQPVENLRVEYNLFARKFSDTGTPSLIAGAKNLKTLRSREDEVFRTSTAEVCKRRDTFYGSSNEGEMRGVWFRLYADGKLLIEQSSPESLMTTEKWTSVTNQE